MQPEAPQEPKVLDNFPTPYEDLDALIQNASINTANNFISKDLEEASK